MAINKRDCLPRERVSQIGRFRDLRCAPKKRSIIIRGPSAEKAEEFLKERSLSSYYDEVALKGLQLAQADAERGALNGERLTKIRDAVVEFANDLSDQDDRPRRRSTRPRTQKQLPR